MSGDSDSEIRIELTVEGVLTLCAVVVFSCLIVIAFLSGSLHGIEKENQELQHWKQSRAALCRAMEEFAGKEGGE